MKKRITYKELIDIFGEETIMERFALLYDSGQDFITVKDVNI